MHEPVETFSVSTVREMDLSAKGFDALAMRAQQEPVIPTQLNSTDRFAQATGERQSMGSFFDLPSIDSWEKHELDDSNASHRVAPRGIVPDLRAFAVVADVGGDQMLLPGETIDVFYDYDNVGTRDVTGTEFDVGF